MASISLKAKVDISIIFNIINRIPKIHIYQPASPSVVFIAKTKLVTCSCFKNGTILLQGRNAQDLAWFAQRISEQTDFPASQSNFIAKTLHDNIPAIHIGSDESGKGDIFGGITVASVLLDDPQKLSDLNIKDSKTIKDTTIRIIAREIKQRTIHSIITLSPTEYNNTYQEYANVNLLLGKLHAENILRISQHTSCRTYVIDKFGDYKFIAQFLPTDHNFEIICITQGETHSIGIAAASILARDAFITQLDDLEKQFNITLPRGASRSTQHKIPIIISQIQPYSISNLGKTHFSPIKNLSNNVT